MLKYKNVGKIRMQKTEEEKEAERSQGDLEATQNYQSRHIPIENSKGHRIKEHDPQIMCEVTTENFLFHSSGINF